MSEEIDIGWLLGGGGDWTSPPHDIAGVNFVIEELTKRIEVLENKEEK